LKVDPHFAPYDAQGSAGHPKKCNRRKRGHSDVNQLAVEDDVATGVVEAEQKPSNVVVERRVDSEGGVYTLLEVCQWYLGQGLTEEEITAIWNSMEVVHEDAD